MPAPFRGVKLNRACAMIFTGVRNTPSLLKLRGTYALTDMVRAQALSVKILGLEEVSVCGSYFGAGSYIHLGDIRLA